MWHSRPRLCSSTNGLFIPKGLHSRGRLCHTFWAEFSQTFTLAMAILPLVLAGTLCSADNATASPEGILEFPSDEAYTEQDARRMMKAASGPLAPVYAPLAAQIVQDFQLAGARGIGIDLGSGPGDLIIELCKRTKLHWVNADINPHFFPHFYAKATAAGVGHRVSALFADAQALPFRDAYATVIVSRGCFFFWEHKARAFAEVYRVLKPGGGAYIGRGFPRDLPLAVAERIRGAQNKAGRGPAKYDPVETEQELRQALEAAGIKGYSIERPQPPGANSKINYGIWVTIRKPK